MNVTRAPGCELCEAARMTPWYHEDDLCWIADCEVCDTPMVVWRHHGAVPSAEDVDVMIDHLDRVATAKFGEGGYTIDRTMRQIPDHFHAHARDRGWWARRFGGSGSSGSGSSGSGSSGSGSSGSAWQAAGE